MRRPNVMESLEFRRLLAAHLPTATADGLPIVEIDWAGSTSPAIAGQWVVQLGGYKGTQASQLNKARRLLGDAVDDISVSQFLLKNGQFTVRLDGNRSLEQQYQVLQTLPGFVSASPDLIYSTNVFPNDPLFSSLWGLHQSNDIDIDAPEAWDITTGSMRQIVGVIDSGVDYNHVDLYQNIYLNQSEIPPTRLANLADIDGDGVITFRDLNNPANQGPFKITDLNGDGRITGADLRVAMGTTSGSDNGTGGWADGIDNDGNFLADDLVGWNFRENNNNPADVFGHGSHVAGTIGAWGNNFTGVTGVNWRVRLLPLKAGGINSSDNTISTSAATSALNYAASLKQRGEDVAATNNSWGGGGVDSALQNAIQGNANLGITFVASAGNNGTNNDSTPHYPSNYTNANVISVLNITQSGSRNTGSNFGAVSVDLGAPGTSILSTTGGGYQFFTGTSMAAPHVAGVVALLKSVNPGLTLAQVRAAILNNVDVSTALNGTCVTGGRLNAHRAVSAVALNPGTAPDLTPGSDSGSSNTDNITNITTPTFTGTAGGNVTVQLRANGTIVGTATSAPDGSWSITSSTLTHGLKTMTVTVTDGVATSGSSPSLLVFIDTIAPTVNSASHPFAAHPQKLTISFSESMLGGLTTDDILLTNLTTSEIIPSSSMSLINGSNVEVRFPGGLLPEGNYTASVLASDAAGNSMAAPFVFDFYVLYGDADRDRDVDIADFARLASNFNQSPRSFAQGDFNYDEIVNIADFAMLASRFNMTLPAPGGLPDGARTGAKPISPFSNLAVRAGEEDRISLDDLPLGQPA